MHLRDVHIGARKSNSQSLNDWSFLNKVAFRRTIISRIWDIISCPGFPIVVHKYSALPSTLHRCEQSFLCGGYL
jgi:hypothetical protein